MSLESTATYINSFNPVWPDGADQRSTADDHIRLIKGALLRSFPQLTAPISIPSSVINNLGSMSFSLVLGGLIDTTKFGYAQTAAELAAGVTPVNLYIPSHDYCPYIIADRYQTNTIPGTTIMTAGVIAARNVAEATASNKREGGKIGFFATTYQLDAVIRLGYFVELVGIGPDSTQISWTDTVTDKCVLMETAGGSYVFGVYFSNIQFSIGNNARWGIFSQGAHQHCGFDRVSVNNVNQIGVELGSLGGPARMDWGKLWVNCGTAFPVSTTLNSSFVTGNTVLTVASTTNFVVGAGTTASPLQRITVVLDSGALHHTTVAAVNPGVSITLAKALPSNASSGKVLRASKIGIICNNASNNEMPILDIEGAFDKCLAAQFGNFRIGNFHSEISDIGIACEQAQVGNGQLVLIGAATGSNGQNILIDVEPQFIGSVGVELATTSQSPAKTAIRNQIDTTMTTVIGLPAADWWFSTQVTRSNYPHYTRESKQFSSETASDWSNRALEYACAFSTAGRIYAPIVYRDTNNATTPLDAVAFGIDYDTSTNAYELIIGTAVSGSALIEKLRIGKNFTKAVNTPFKEFTTTVAGLPTASSSLDGCTAMVTDGTVVAAGNFGAAVVGGGGNHVHVYCDGGTPAWRIG